MRTILEENQVLPKGSEILILQNDHENGKACLEAVRKADYVILVYRTYEEACLDPDTEEGFSSAVFDRIIEARHQDGKAVIVVSCSHPYDAARFREADAILLTYMSSPIRQISLENGHETDYAPDLPCVPALDMGKRRDKCR